MYNDHAFMDHYSGVNFEASTAVYMCSTSIANNVSYSVLNIHKTSHSIFNYAPNMS